VASPQPVLYKSYYLGKRLTLLKKTAAIEIASDESGRTVPGLMVHLAEGSRVRVCGDGFSSGTVRIESEGNSYFVLLQSIVGAALDRT
jgi:hypothetical protein